VKIIPFLAPVREAPASDARPRMTSDGPGDGLGSAGGDLATISRGALERAQPQVDEQKVARLKREIEAREISPSPARIAAKLLED
jgi:anti-sigma28 factor (negative regulator of flagellin synthesis)